MADPGGYARAVPLYVDYQRVPPGLTLAASAIRDGSVISLGGPEGCVYPEPTGLAEVRVAGGPGAGAVHRLGIGEADIGGGQGARHPGGRPAGPRASRCGYPSACAASAR